MDLEPERLDNREIVDSVIAGRIKERRRQIQAEISKVELSIQNANRWKAARALPQRISRALKRGGKGDINEEELLKRLSTDRAILTYDLEHAARVVEGQIRANRRSYQLYWLRKFLGDPIEPEDIDKSEILPYFDFPYDGGEWDQKPQKVDVSERVFRSAQEVIDRCKYSLEQGNGSVTLYDTSIPQAQARHEVIIDALEQFGFAIDESLRRNIAVMAADSSMNEHAMDEFRGRSPKKPAHRFVDGDWIQILPDGTARGYIRLEGHSDDPPKQKNEMSLSQLCRNWNVSHLIAELSYKRTANDVQLTLDLHRELDVLDAGRNLPIPVIVTPEIR